MVRRWGGKTQIDVKYRQYHGITRDRESEEREREREVRAREETHREQMRKVRTLVHLQY